MHYQRSKAHRQRGIAAGGLIQHAQQVLADIHLWRVIGNLRHPKHGSDFGQYFWQRTAGIEGTEHVGRLAAHQAQFQFLPCVGGAYFAQGAVFHLLEHQFEGFIIKQSVGSGGEGGQAQQAKGGMGLPKLG